MADSFKVLHKNKSIINEFTPDKTEKIRQEIIQNNTKNETGKRRKEKEWSNFLSVEDQETSGRTLRKMLFLILITEYLVIFYQNS